MNSQLDQLQSVIETLIRKYQAAAQEQARLTRELATVRAQSHENQQQHQAAMDKLKQLYQSRFDTLEADKQQKLQALQKENAEYRMLLAQTGEEVRKLLDRLPALPEKKEGKV